MDVIGHDHERIHGGAGEMFRDCLPTFGNDPSHRREADLPARNLPE
jgi:hypothetical protein